jgi:hypothetical protein
MCWGCGVLCGEGVELVDVMLDVRQRRELGVVMSVAPTAATRNASEVEHISAKLMADRRSEYDELVHLREWSRDYIIRMIVYIARNISITRAGWY